MRIIINNSSEQPIYEQIISQIKSLIISQELKEHQILPSVRTLSKDLRISALTVKKSYDILEKEGFIITVHGKGSYVAGTNQELLKEESRRAVEADLESAIQKGLHCGMDKQELTELFHLILDE